MLNGFDQFPVYDALIKPKSLMMSDDWIRMMTTFYENLTNFLSPGGLLLPQLTSDERDSILDVQNGQMIYNTTLDTAQYFKAGAWVSF